MQQEKQNSNLKSTSLSAEVNEDKQVKEYDQIQLLQPIYEEAFSRSLYYPSYTDRYDTGTEFSLRELLLLMWWGFYRTGRFKESRIPKYFFDKYNLDPEKLTAKFVGKGWLVEHKDKYQLSDEAKENFYKYQDLWKMHQFDDDFPICLDEDFSNWHDGKLLRKFSQEKIGFWQKQIMYENKLIAFYKKYPDFLRNNQYQKSEIRYLTYDVKKITASIYNIKEKMKNI